MKKATAIILSLALAFALTACMDAANDTAAEVAPYEEETEDSVTEPTETTKKAEAEQTGAEEDTSSDGTASDRDYLETVRQNTVNETRREYQTVVYSKSGEGESAQTQVVSMRINIDASIAGDEKLSANGTVKAMGEVMPLNMYYSGGSLVSESNGNTSVDASTYEEALNTVDVLYSLYEAFFGGVILDVSVCDNADSTRLISLSFSGLIGGSETSGSGDIIVNGDGLIISESFSLSAVDETSNLPVSQSIESSLISIGEDTPELTPIAGNS